MTDFDQENFDCVNLALGMYIYFFFGLIRWLCNEGGCYDRLDCILLS